MVGCVVPIDGTCICMLHMKALGDRLTSSCSWPGQF